MAKQPEAPDVRQLREAGLPEARFPSGGPQDFRICFAEEVHNQIARHAEEDTAVEIGGVLVGCWERDAEGPFVVISQAIRCDAATSRSGEVTFTHEAWNHINREMDTRFADLKIVGWYHSHPNFGIFLSERDRFIQQHFFGNPGQVAYVVDPVRKSEGVFVWRQGQPQPAPHYWIGQRILAPTDAEEPGPRRGPDAGRHPAADQTQPYVAPGEAGATGWLGSVRGWLLGLLVFLLGYLLAGQRSAWEQRMLVEGAVAHYGLWKGLRPGLREFLSAVDARMQDLSRDVELLSKEHIQLAGDAAQEKKEQWRQVRGALGQLRQALREISTLYALSPEENAAVQKLFIEKEAELQALREKSERSDTPSPPASASGKPALPGKDKPDAPAAEQRTSAAEKQASGAEKKPPGADRKTPGTEKEARP
jgi:proteasome lid subunit RPN8/RPN11